MTSGRTDPAGLAAITEWMRDYVDRGLLPGALTLVGRHGQIEFLETYGLADVEASTPVAPDTLFRIYSMTKPVTAVAALMLIEQGNLGLDDAVALYIPSFANLTVNRLGSADTIETEPLEQAMTVRHLLTHTSGLTYGGGNLGAVSLRYEELATDFGPDDGALAEIVDRLAMIPLLFQPGTAWNYGVSSDVLGLVVEAVTGMALDEFMRTRIFEPLEMVDTSFQVVPDQAHRLSALYEAGPDGELILVESPADTPYLREVTTFSGGAGLISTAADYFRFAEMLRRGGSLDGVRVLKSSTVELMTRNQLPADLAAMGQQTFNETSTSGVGFGLGVSVVVDPAAASWDSELGEYAWGGYASTAFWVDPANDLTVIFMTQVMPSDRYPLRAELRSLALAAFRDDNLSDYLSGTEIHD